MNDFVDDILIEAVHSSFLSLLQNVQQVIIAHGFFRGYLAL
jgi:hypothetical protein